MVLTVGAVLVVLLGLGLCNAMDKAWRNRWRQCGGWRGRGAQHLQTTCREIDAPFVRCRKKYDCQKRLSSMVAEVCRRLEVPTVVAVDLQVFPENLGRLYIFSNRDYWSGELGFWNACTGAPKLVCGMKPCCVSYHASFRGVQFQLCHSRTIGAVRGA